MRADADVRGLLHVGGLADGEGLPLEGVRLRPGAALRLAGGGPAAAERALLRTGGYLVRVGLGLGLGLGLGSRLGLG